MPYASRAQSRFVHMKAGQGAPWAKKFAADADRAGKGSVRRLPRRVKKVSKK